MTLTNIHHSTPSSRKGGLWKLIDKFLSFFGGSGDAELDVIMKLTPRELIFRRLMSAVRTAVTIAVTEVMKTDLSIGSVQSYLDLKGCDWDDLVSAGNGVRVACAQLKVLERWWDKGTFTAETLDRLIADLRKAVTDPGVDCVACESEPDRFDDHTHLVRLNLLQEPMTEWMKKR